MLPYAGILAGLAGLRSGWAAILGYHAGMAIVLSVGGGWTHAARLRRGFDARALVMLSASCASAGPLLVLLWPLAALPGAGLSGTLAGLGLHGPAWTGFVAYYLAVNPLLEEIYWRSFYAEPTDRLAPSDVLYAGYHGVVVSLFIGPAWTALVLAILVSAGWVWRQAANRTDGLAVPVASHLVADASIIAAAVFLESR